jgi:hypothetical protein
LSVRARLSSFLSFVLVPTCALGACLVSIPDVRKPSRPAPGSCGLATPAFCETFDTASPGGRSGDLDESRWNVARLGKSDPSQGLVDFWPSLTFPGCGQTMTASGDKDLVVCGGQLVEPLAGSYLGLRIRQPIDLSSATDTSPVTLAFDVDAAQNQIGTDYLDVWITDQALPFVADWIMNPPPNPAPNNGIGVRFGTCPMMPGLAWIQSAFVSTGGTLQVLGPPVDSTRAQADQCFAVQPGMLNHVELHFLASSIELWASDEGQPDTFRWLSSVPTGALPLRRGYVGFVHTSTSGTAQHLWDNIGFDGPYHPAPRAADAPDSLASQPDGGVNLGYSLGDPNGPDGVDVTFAPLDLSGARSAHVDFTVFAFDSSRALYYCINPPTGPCTTYQSTLQSYNDAPVDIDVTMFLSQLAPGKNNQLGNMKIVAQSSPGYTVLANATLTVEVE